MSKNGKRGRDAGSGQFIPVKVAERRSRTAIVETFKKDKDGKPVLLLQRRNLKRKFLDLENAIRHSLKVFGIRLGKVGRGGMEKAVRDAVAGDPMTAGLMDCMLRARAALWAEYLTLHKLATQLAMRDDLCRRFMASLPRAIACDDAP